MDIKEARRLTGLSQAQLDAAAGVRLGTTMDLESGRNKNPSHSTVVRIVRALHQRGLAGLTTEDLFPVTEVDRAPRRKAKGRAA